MLSFIAKSVTTLVGLQAALVSAKPVGSKDLGCTSRPPSANANSSFVNTVYFTQWGIYGRDYQVADLPTNEISHVLYAFLNFGPNGTLFSGDTWADVERPGPNDTPANATGRNAYGNVGELFKLKQANRQVKTQISIGGWTWSTHFAAAASTAATRLNFARSAVGYMKDWGFDGLEIDWEYPTNEVEANDMILLLQALRDEMDAYAAKYADNHHFLLSIAAPAGPERIRVLKLAEIGKLVDYVYLMAYDYSGSWNNATGHNSAVFPSKFNPISTPSNTEQAVEMYLDGGIPSQKLVLGMPLYGRAFQSTAGIGRPYNGTGPGQWEAGVYDYKALPRAGAEIACDKQAIACYSYDSSTRELISFDTPSVVRDKVDYAKSRGLGGSMFWEASGDKVGEESLISTSYNSLGSVNAEQNWLSYPDSQYTNIASARV
ncbi:Chitinase 1 [Paramyrothecium foliicola]|nr:Chitinase 1 [Paramyrothecium foliicola]